MDKDVAERIRAARSFSQLAAALSGQEVSKLAPRTIAMVVRGLRGVELPPPEVRVALMGSHTLEPLAEAMQVAGLVAGVRVECSTAPYGQYVHAVTTSVEDLRRFNPDIILLSVELRSVAARIAAGFSSLTPEDVERECSGVISHLLGWAEYAQAASRATVLIANFPRPARPGLGLADLKHVPSEAGFHLRLNAGLIDALRESDRLGIFDLDAVISACGWDNAWSDRMNFVARQPWTPTLVGYAAQELWRHIVAAKGWARKCLVLDLDNTLWGGVVGEDGPMALRIGAGDPDGEAFAEFQRAILELKQRGVLLAVASKNNSQDVDAAFESRPEMPLRKEDFAVVETGWHPKVDSIQNIATRLNIGLDSLVFLDDNPAERALVRGALPEVLTPELPDDPARYARFLRRQAWFERPRITTEDVAKTTQYREQVQREVLRESAGDISRYLGELRSEIQVWRALPGNVARAHQLFSKTNQFNVTTLRYSLGEVREMIQSPGRALWLARAQDRFGDLDIIGLCLLECAGDDVVIDSFLMSCRALGRGLETAFMNTIKLDVRGSGAAGKLRARFAPTARNAPARGFFESQGFAVVGTDADGVISFESSIKSLEAIPVPHITVS